MLPFFSSLPSEPELLSSCHKGSKACCILAEGRLLRNKSKARESTAVLAEPQSSPTVPAEDNTGRLCLHLQVPHFPALAVLMMQSSSELMATCLPLWNMPLFGGEQAVLPLTLSQASCAPSLLRVQPSWAIGKEKPVNLYPTRSPALLQTPGPAAFPKIEVDTYKRRAPIYTMGVQTRIGGDRTCKPGPADYCTGKVRQPAHLSCSVFQQAPFKHLPLLLSLQRTNGLLPAGTGCRTAGLLPAPDPSRGRAEDTSFPFHSLRPYTQLAHSSPSVRAEFGDTLQIHREGRGI